MTSARIVDVARVKVEGGRGGSGCVAFRREIYVPMGGPSGGDGGHGGSVVLVVDENRRTLLDFRYQRRFAGERGEHGQGKERTGASGKDVEVAVPTGTVVRDAATHEVIVDLTRHGERFVVARGGRGGKGNMHYSSPTNRAPREWEPGGLGESREILLELKLIADAGLVGLPNAGKSTLLSRLSAARPKIADYPFTTLRPYLGVVSAGEYSSFILADIPGIIEGASEGRGLGLDFLRHIDRTRILVYLVDATQPDPAGTLATLEAELHAYDPVLSARPSLVALTKLDAAGPSFPVPPTLGGRPVLAISSVTGEGIPALVGAIWQLLRTNTERDLTRAEETP